MTGSLCFAGVALPTARAGAAETPHGAAALGESGTAQQLDLAVLLAAYPGVIVEVVDEDGRFFVVTRSGKRFVYDDGRAKSADEALEAPDLEDMLAQPYQPGPLAGDPPAGQHPGRRRVTEFLTEVYGRDAAEVSAACRPVRFLDRTVPFNTRNGAADALERVAARLEDLVARDRGLRDVLYPVVGTFNWRTIAGTSRLSMHALGIAVDVNPGRNPYWRHHRRPSDKLARRQSFPEEVVAAFEAEGFIWGGKWAEYDIMHFEYRPELLIKARALRGDRSGLVEGKKSDKNGHAAQ
ncbi:M15 family metallopeptidase [Desulfovibrio sulfodismutans]|uniref:M15 family metallopeptidase n=1 Tax=Desulfolutivibrio sulfodismutans TaxID=63561 RepID=A0A7K3NRA2_9BACT|nr:M15 family metallopeptidase [Desulfolutivibrio sulfodismutans]NDY58730.1 M15 family metallopeptidase [Desulfolutivibrio sulfodismutans]QLA14142.1 M15 family peptidase [Desulfolutivibrio sulfodismutans DSM 3696]